MDKNYTSKRIQLAKANQLIFASIAVSVFIVIFSIFAIKNLISQSAYQQRVISKKSDALNILTGDLDAISKLETSYKSFINQPQNLIGGNPTGTSGNDGNNSKIVLDALPTSYDTNSWILNFINLNKLLGQPNTFIDLGGAASTPAATSTSVSSSSSSMSGASLKPTNVVVPITGSFKVPFGSIASTFANLNRSILPIQVLSMNFTAGADGAPADVTYAASTFYQPPYQFNIGSEDIK